MTAHPEEAITEITLAVPKDAAGKRLDQFLGESLEEFSRSYLKKLILAGAITIGGVVPKPARSVRAGEDIDIRLPEPEKWDVHPQDLPLDTVFSDDDIIVVNKAAGMVVHPAPGHRDGTLVNAVLHHFGDLSTINGVLRPGVVHRLDSGTSGLIVLARNDRALRSLSAQFAARTVTKKYFAIVHGRPQAGVTISLPIGRHRTDFRRMAVRPDVGKEAVTVIERAKPLGDLTAVHIRLLTGRTHQIRVHMKHTGFPLLCDGLYGKEDSYPSSAAPLISRCALHSRELTISHPADGRVMRFTARLPKDMLGVLSSYHGGKAR